MFNGCDIGSVSRTRDGRAGFDWTRSLSLGAPLTFGFLDGDLYTLSSTHSHLHTLVGPDRRNIQRAVADCGSLSRVRPWEFFRGPELLVELDEQQRQGHQQLDNLRFRRWDRHRDDIGHRARNRGHGPRLRSQRALPVQLQQQLVAGADRRCKLGPRCRKHGSGRHECLAAQGWHVSGHELHLCPLPLRERAALSVPQLQLGEGASSLDSNVESTSPNLVC
jgi:hypothetical protein